MLDVLLEQLRRGDRRALSRLLSLVARGERLREIQAALPERDKPSRVVAITGSGGVGKSTLVGKLIDRIRGQSLTVAVLACDPQSPLSGGALLGDRFRMPARPEDDGVFIRSLATAGGRGAVADHLPLMVGLLQAFGFDVVLIETVGAGQGDTAVRDLADVVVLLLQPETGDDLQWEKAGLLEVADVVAIHKSDLPGAANAEADVRAALGLTESHSVPVLRVSSKTGEGINDLWAAVSTLGPRPSRVGPAGPRLLRLALDSLADWFGAARKHQDSELRQLITRWQEGTLGPDAAVASLLHLAGKRLSPAQAAASADQSPVASE
jgi:LAO/AO transport system ATPase